MPRFRIALAALAAVAYAPRGIPLAAAQTPAPPSAPPPSSPPASAPAPSAPRAMSLPDALAYARAHQPAVRAALARVHAAEAEAKVPRGAWLPTVGATAQVLGATSNNTTASYFSQPYVDIPRIGGSRVVASGTWKPYASTLVGVGANQEVFDFGRIAAEAAAADARIDVEKMQAAGQTLDVTFGVEEAYFAVFAAKSVVKASDEAYDRAKVHRDLAQAGVSSGLRSPIELTRAEADLSRFDIGRLRARGNLAVAQTVYAAAVGVDDAALDVLEAPPSPRDMPSLADAIAQASAKDPRIASALAALKAEEQRTTAIGAALRPDLTLSATLTGRAGGATPSGNGETANGNGWIPNVPNWDVGVVLSWPIFDGMVVARKEASRAREEVRREELALAKQEDVASLRQAYAAVGIARGVLPGLEHAVDAARANYAQADARFKSGLGTSVELADAEALRADAEIQLALGQFELARARAAFGRAIAEGL